MQPSENRPFFDISPLSREIASGNHESIYTPHNAPNPERVDLLRRERFEIGAVLVERIVNRSFEAYFNKVERISDPTESKVNSFISGFLDKAADDELMSLKQLSKDNPEDPLAKLYERYHSLAMQSASGVTILTDKMFIMDAVPYAIRAMGMVYNSIDKVFAKNTGDEPDENARKDIGRKSFAVVSHMASMFILDFNAISLNDDVLSNPDNFDLISLADSGYMLVFSEEFKGFLEGSKSHELIYQERMRCPGLVSFEDKPSAIKRLWDLYVDLS